MSVIKKIKRKFLVLFRQIFLYNNSSIEFRAKVYASIASTNSLLDECEKELIKEFATEIYSDDEERADVLIEIIQEYIDKLITSKALSLDELLFSINSDIKQNPEFVKKIDLDNLKKLMECNTKDDKVIQLRVYEFLENRVKEYNKQREKETRSADKHPEEKDEGFSPKIFG